ncbi:hypothetical protein [Dactylosporangium sp. CA-233914]|uniref:hypothetical protein n=1 Tax=Dactylosporangium sp. CA-233914 TaxID=3239934 RepID=UPI003D8DF9C9
MNCKTQVVLAAGIGYLLGRQHKLRWALLLAAAAGAGRLGRPGSLLDHGARALKATPELGKLGEMGAPLVAATKEAARTAVTDRIDSISDRLRERTDTLQKRGKAREPEEEEPEEERPRRPARGPRAAGGARRPRQRAEEEDESDEYEYADEEDEDTGEREDEDEDLARAGRRSSGRPPVRRRRED